jgi:hypothetical protein
MKGILLVLPGLVLCAATLHSAAADPAVPLQTKTGEELHSAVTDMPDIIDMSHADPKSWHSLPPGGISQSASTARRKIQHPSFREPQYRLCCARRCFNRSVHGM